MYMYIGRRIKSLSLFSLPMVLTLPGETRKRMTKGPLVSGAWHSMIGPKATGYHAVHANGASA